MRRDGDLELQGRRAGDLDLELLRPLLASFAAAPTQFAQRNGGEADRGVANPVGQHQGVSVNECAAGVDHIGNVPVLLVCGRTQQRLVQTAQHFRRVIEIEHDRTYPVGTHWADPVREHQPSGFGFNR